MKRYKDHMLELKYYLIIEKLREYGTVRSNRMIIRRLFVLLFRYRLRKRLKRLHDSYINGYIYKEVYEKLELTIKSVL